MRRILLVFSVALVMAAMVVATAAPAFASRGGGDGPDYLKASDNAKLCVYLKVPHQDPQDCTHP